MKWSLVPVLALALGVGGAWAGAPRAASEGPVVATAAGPVIGMTLEDGSVAFRGIPYAKPPVGELRWRPPVETDAWSAPRPAVAEPPACPQSVYGGWNRHASEHSSEDCLYLSVRTPNLHPARRLPVMVWFHGGGNRAGNGTEVILDNSGSGAIRPADLVGKGVVLVGFNYRLAALGFLSHPALTRESPDHASGNYALMDQQSALAWVKRNIARFGGDPGNVTVFGLSAGAKDINLLLLSPRSKGLFAKAIAESGPPGGGLAERTLAENEAVGRIIAAKAGAAPDADAADLRRLPVSALVEADHDIDAPGLNDADHIWASTADGVVLPERLEELLRRAASPVPLIIGTNENEYVTGDVKADPQAVIARRFGKDVAKARAAYGALPADKLPITLATDLYFRCPSLTVAKARAGAGRPVWVYNWNHPSADGATVRHTSESAYVFDASLPGSPPIQAYWLNFARTGDPNGAGLPRWPRYDTKARAHIEFGVEGTKARSNLHGAACDLVTAF
ncbi:carboxylesterase family protein [Sphingomonas sp. dw_22]|uniref:carboxylesterase/lipase family protein n=1 Tax=Sphingomonas sp. dw_22 TaxID=2721175 RepID=UPI001BD5A4F8|nr:carboxylesterase family protein [Sphingomonas sp. dw_22]